MIQLEQIEGYRILRPNLRRSSESKNITTLHQIERKNERQEEEKTNVEESLTYLTDSDIPTPLIHSSHLLVSSLITSKRISRNIYQTSNIILLFLALKVI